MTIDPLRPIVLVEIESIEISYEKDRPALNFVEDIEKLKTSATPSQNSAARIADGRNPTRIELWRSSTRSMVMIHNFACRLGRLLPEGLSDFARGMERKDLAAYQVKI
jgi:hypothetical protein